MSNISYLGAFLGGILSFLSPCVLPLIPSYVSYITGISFEDFKAGDKAHAKHIRLVTLINSSAFILGFSTVFVLLGVSSSFLGKYLAYYYDQIRIVGGTVIIFFGLYVMGVIKLNFLSAEHRVHLKHKPRGYLGSVIVGLTFGAGWTPCIGPILGSILLVAGTSGSVMYGFKLLVVYSLGLAIPFLATSLAMSYFISHFSAIQKYMRVIMILSGLLLISFGILLLSDRLYLLLGAVPDFGLDEMIKH
ncbi:MAG: cytochrome c biogenesis protein CcdA [Thermodesulfovibrionia bacterium]|nr:cytochrome c biogenesis protein CcdA [Thermodesulfovibrionia bacterium]